MEESGRGKSGEPAREKRPAPYHHGDLKAALLRAAEQELERTGIEGFSLRSVAKRAGVSHAAPAHHFGDVGGLLTALAAEGFRRFLSMQKQAMAAAPADPRSQLMAAGLGYVRFASAAPALFRLIFSSDRPDFENPELSVAADESYDMLVRQILEATGKHPAKDRQALRNLQSVWAMAHGLADLLAAGRLKSLSGLPDEEREAEILKIVGRALE
jgi:AcrR family transcriptional regulator